MESLQKKAVRWITAPAGGYKVSLLQISILPVSLYLQVIDLLLLSKFLNYKYDVNPYFHLKVITPVLEQGLQTESYSICLTSSEKSQKRTSGIEQLDLRIFCLLRSMYLVFLASKHVYLMFSGHSFGPAMMKLVLALGQCTVHVLFGSNNKP